MRSVVTVNRDEGSSTALAPHRHDSTKEANGDYLRRDNIDLDGYHTYCMIGCP